MNQPECEKQSPEVFNQEIETAITEGALYFVAYDKKKGEPFAIIAAPHTEVCFEGDDLTKDFINILKALDAKSEKLTKFIDKDTFYVYASPGCGIKRTASGGYKVVC